MAKLYAPAVVRVTGLLVATLLASSLFACGDDGAAPRDDGSDAGPAPDAFVDAGPPLAPLEDAHTCVEGAASAAIAWESLQNPILRLDDHALKDVSVRHHEGRWWLFGSRIAGDPFRFRLGVFTSSDLSEWTLESEWDDEAVGGLASPDVTRHPAGYVAVYNSHTTDVEGALPKLYHRVAPDLAGLSDAPSERLAESVFGIPIERLIDAALAHTEDGLLLAFKRFQTFTLALAPSGRLEGPWEILGEAAIADTVENYQFLPIDGGWHLLATTIPAHEPRLYARGERWTAWTEVTTFAVPEEDWNTDERANAAFLCDGRAVDGHWYLFYAGSTETESFDGRGYAAVGVARSTDLEAWSVPGG